MAIGFDGLGAITGHIYADTVINNIKGVTYPKAYRLLMDAYSSVNNGWGGFTANDARQLAKIVDAIGKQYGISDQTSNVSYQLKFMADNNRLKDKVDLGLLDTYFNTISPTTLTGSSTGYIKNGEAYNNGKSSGTLPNQVAKEVVNGPTVKVTVGNNTNSNNSSNDNYSGGGGGGSLYIPGYGTIDQSQGWTDEQLGKILDAINGLKPAEPLTAEELAAKHDIDYNEQHILDEYNERTNKFYQDTIDEYYDLRNNLVNQASRGNQRTINDYLGEWTNAAPTAARRGELAANALSAYMNANYDINAEDYNLMQAQNGLRSMWDAELAANPNTARQQYNAMGTTLASLSANLNQSQVKQYIDQLDAYSQMYAANRAIGVAAAQGVASQYAGLANAAATNASTAASKYNSWQQLYNYYKNAYGATDKQASTAVTNNLQQSSGINKNT